MSSAGLPPGAIVHDQPSLTAQLRLVRAADDVLELPEGAWALAVLLTINASPWPTGAIVSAGVRTVFWPAAGQTVDRGDAAIIAGCLDGALLMEAQYRAVCKGWIRVDCSRLNPMSRWTLPALDVGSAARIAAFTRRGPFRIEPGEPAASAAEHAGQ